MVRTGKQKRQEELGERTKRKCHSPPPNQVDFEKENLLKEVTNMKDGEKVKLTSCEILPYNWYYIQKEFKGELRPKRGIKHLKLPLSLY